MNFRIRRPTMYGALAFALVAAACSDDNGGTGPTPTPTAPTTVTATAAGQTVTVTFAGATNATGFEVQRAAGATGGTFATVGTPAASPYTDANVAAGTYRYRVAATRGADKSAYTESAAVTVTAVNTGPGARTITQDITSNQTWHSDTVYTLSGFIHVANGATLTIEPGTRIIGDFNTLGSSLLVLRGAKLIAKGTAAAPIVFTSSQAVGSRQAGDWGGLIIVGNASINRTGDPQIEGTGTTTGTTSGTNYPVTYGNGTNDADNSGELSYVRVEFAGYGPQPNQELNSFTFAAVGSGTKADHLQALYGLDDNYEWFGGGFDMKYLVSYESGDDHFDMSEGFRGRIQYAIAYQSVRVTPRPGAGNVSGDPQGIENDGCDGAGCVRTNTPHNIPLFANFTLVGTGPGVITGSSGGIGMLLRRGTGGYYINGVVARWPLAAISLRDAETQQRIDAGDLIISNMVLADNGTAFETGTGRLTYTTNGQVFTNVTGTAASLFQTLPTTPTNAASFDWTPVPGSAATTDASVQLGAVGAKGAGFLENVLYRGAAAPNGPDWWAGWTNYARN